MKTHKYQNPTPKSSADTPTTVWTAQRRSGSHLVEKCKHVVNNGEWLERVERYTKQIKHTNPPNRNSYYKLSHSQGLNDCVFLYFGFLTSKVARDKGRGGGGSSMSCSTTASCSLHRAADLSGVCRGRANSPRFLPTIL